MSPRPSIIPIDGTDTSTDSTTATLQSVQQQLALQQQQQNIQNNNTTKTEPGKPPSRAGACRVCLKSFKPDDFSKTCFECQQRVCEDCASYSKLDDTEDDNTWRCSVCRRKMASRVCLPQDSTDSLLDVPVLEALQRRHSDVKIGSTSNLGVSSNGTGLAPPRSPDLRRHSDVSPASLKELEKLKGNNTPGDLDWRRGNRSVAPSRSNSPPRKNELGLDTQTRSRRQSIRVSRQHSYDEEIKSGSGGGQAASDLGLGVPAPMPRRASAYDVFAPGVLAAVQANVAKSDPEPIRPGSRRPSFRVPPQEDQCNRDNSPSPDNISSPALTVEDDRRMRRRGSQLPDIAALRDRGALPINQLPPPPAYQQPALEDLEAPRRQTSMDGEAIKIVIHDVDSGTICASKRRIVLKKDPADKAHRTRGFGMRVVGGKTGADGRLFAYIVWTVPGGPAEKAGLQQGDKILEWNGVSLIDRSFDEVCAIMDRTGDVLELLVEHATDFRMCDLLDEQIPPGGSSGHRKSGDGVGLGLVPDNETTCDKSPSSPTRRKLPKTPEQIQREKTVSGRVQIQVWYHGERNELVVSLMAGDDLAYRDDSGGHGNLPEAYAKVKIAPRTGDGHVAQTEVSPPTLNPIWNATLSFCNIPPENLMDRSLAIELWDLVPQTESVFLGECTVDLQKAFLDDRAVWYRLEDPKQLRQLTASQPSKTPNASPRGSLACVDVSRVRRTDYLINRSMSDDVDSIGDGASLLHPDHAWIAGSRRGSSQSETLEVEVYNLGKDFSRSLPGSRRSSFQDREENKEIEATPPPPSYNRDRRRSSCVRRDPDEILRSLKAVKGELGRTMSLTGPTEKTLSRSSSRRASRVSSRKQSVMELPELFVVTNQISPPSDDDLSHATKWKGSANRIGSTSSKTNTSTTNLHNMGSSTSNLNTTSIIMPKEQQNVILGPAQIQPKGYRLISGRYGELKLDFVLTKGMLEVDVISARNIVPVDCETPPDTYVKCYLKDGERLKYKKKTRVVRHSAEPNYKQVLKYGASDIQGRNVVIMVWQRCIGFEHNQGLGGAELNFDKLGLSKHIGGWYPLFPMHSFGSDPNDSP